MAGQGSPTASKQARSASARLIELLPHALLILIAWFVVFSVAICPALAAVEPDGPPVDPVEVRLRISFGGGKPRAWQGQIRITNDDAQFQSLAPLGLSAQANAAISQRGNAILVSHQSETDYNAVDVSVRGSLAAELSFDILAADDPSIRTQYSVRLIDLLRRPAGQALDQEGNECSISRVPGDELTLNIDRPHLVFRPDEPLVFSLSTNLTEFQSTALNCRFQITPARREDEADVLWRHSVTMETDAAGSGAPMAMTVPVPAKEGVYDLHIMAQPANTAAVGDLAGGHLTRKIQFVVLSEKPSSVPAKTAARRVGDGKNGMQLGNSLTRRAQKAGSGRHSNQTKVVPWQTLIEWLPEDLLDDGQATWPKKLTDSINRSINKSIQRMTQGRRGERSDYLPLGNPRRQLVEVPGNPTAKQLNLSPGGWQAVPISVPAQTELCLIEVDYAVSGGDDEIALGVSLMKPDATGQISSLGQDSGVFVPRSTIGPSIGNETSPQIQTHQVYHWPNDQTAWLVLANRHANSSAQIAAVRVLTGPKRIPAQAAADNRLPAAKRRQTMAFFEDPHFPRNLGASEYLDPAIGQPLHDWVTFYEGAKRLIEYLKANGNTGAMIAVAAEGSGLYPSSILRPGPSCDNGAFQSGAQDPLRKDVVELLFRMFEREGLAFVPALTLNGPVAALEELPNSHLVDYGGKVVLPQQDSTLPRYNPLDQAVQATIASVVREFAARYRGHKQFSSLAITLRPDTYTLLPGQQWACDSKTIKRFIADSADLADIEEIAEQSHAEQVTALLGRFRKPWLAWRAEQMAESYRRMRDAVRSQIPTGDLILAPIDLYRNAETSAALNPALHSSSDFNAVMLQMGFDDSWRDGGSDNEGVRLLSPHRVSPASSLASRRVEWHVDRSPVAKEFYRSTPQAGQLFTHRGDWVHFAQLQQQPPLASQRGALTRRQQLAPAGPAARRRFVQGIRDADSQLLVDGGRILPTGQETEIAKLNRVFGQLPAVAFEDVSAVSGDSEAGATEVEPEALPVVVRQATVAGQSYFYAVNTSPWPIQVLCRLAVGEVATRDNAGAMQVAFESLAGGSFEPIDLPSGSGLKLTLAPWSLTGGVAAASHAPLASYSIAFPEDADLHLRKEIYRLQGLLVQSAESSPMDGLSNPGFELTTEQGLDDVANANVGDDAALPVGWSSGNAPLRLQSNDAHEGQRAVVLVSQDDQPAWIRSNEFAAPQTGRLSVSAWLKTDQPDQPLPLRISLEGNAGGISYYRFGSIGSLSPNPDVNQVSGQWQRYAVHFDDLPLEDLDRFRIGFDLMGPGQVSIDQVQIYDRWFDENDSKAMTQLLATASALLESPATYDRARRLLDGYWPRFLDEHFRDRGSVEADATNAPKLTADGGSASSSSTTIDESSSMDQPVPKQGLLRFRNVFGPRKPRVR